MTQYDGPVFVQPGEPAEANVEQSAPRARPVAASAALLAAMVSLVAGAFGHSGLTYLLSQLIDGMAELRFLAPLVAVLWIGGAIVAVVLGLIALRRREDGRLRTGIALGAAGVGLATVLAMLLQRAIYGLAFA